MSHFRVELPVFNGPLDLLLHLIERQELDITAVSLAQVTDQYLTQVRRLGDQQLEQLIDFISIGARLLVIKSRALLPQPPIIAVGEEEEEDPAEALLRQLRVYKKFKSAASWLDERRLAGLRTYLRVAPLPHFEGKLDLSGVTIDTLLNALADILEREEMLGESLSVVTPRAITIEDQMKLLRERLGTRPKLIFTDMLARPHDRTEIAVTLLALLELIKRREARAEQLHLFGPIEITAQKTVDGETYHPDEG